MGKRLARLRKDNDLTLLQVSCELGVPTSTYRDWEYGTLITGEPYVKLASIFKVTLEFLMTGQTNNEIQEKNLNHVKNICLSMQELIENWNTKN